MRLTAYLDFAVGELLREDFSYLTQATDYDTCWAARLTNNDGTLAYPHLLEALAGRQHPDGSWGSQVPYIHDRLLSTLAIVLLLRRFGHRERDREQRIAGERYIWQHVGQLHYDAHKTIGFEMILPTLLAEGRELGLDLPYAQLRYYEEERAKKLSLLPTDRLFKTTTTALFSLEAFAGSVELEGVAGLLSEDGSMAGSPSATAFLLNQTPDWCTRFPQSAAHLNNLLKRDGAGLPALSSYEIFARAWVLHYLYYGGLLSGHKGLLSSHYEYLRKHWRPKGVGWSPYVFPDSDNTAVVLLMLHQAGYEVDGSCLLACERDEHFAVYDYELDPSISVNLNILEALGTLPETDRLRVRDKILRYIFNARQPGGYWADKWHASAYYPTSKALIALLPHAPEQMGDTLNWLLATQRADGSWGQYISTAEETALALLPLLFYHRAGRSLPREPLRLAARYLLSNENPFKRHYPELWVGKALFAPPLITRSIILSALGLYHNTFGDLG